MEEFLENLAHNLTGIDQKFPRRVVQVAANDSYPREHVTHPENSPTSRAVFTVPGESLLALLQLRIYEDTIC